MQVQIIDNPSIYLARRGNYGGTYLFKNVCFKINLRFYYIFL